MFFCAKKAWTSLVLSGIWPAQSAQWGFPGGSEVKNPSAVQYTQETWVWHQGWEDPGGEGNGNPVQYSYLEDPMDRGAWKTTVYAVAKSQTQLSTV